MKKKWVLRDKAKELPNLPEYPAFILNLLALRGFTDAGKAKEYLNIDYIKLHDPFLFVHMEKACDRIWQAIKDNEKIIIYSDYDADAITALAVMYKALSQLGAKDLGYYIPDRFTEGYGMNPEAVRKLCEDGAKLIITVDCGINAVEEVVTAKSFGVDVIITDHHELTGELPQAFAVINPKNPEDQYPFKYLTGVGVAFKVVQALSRNTQHVSGITMSPGWEKWLLDLVAIGTVADLQPLTDENRIITSFGLKVLHRTKWPGLKAILKLAGVDGKISDTYTLGFIIAPRINAAGRIKHADIAFKLLICEDQAEAEKLALELNALNTHRQQLTEQVLSEARDQIQLISDKKVLLAAGSDWPKGVVGLVAGKLVEEYGRPVLVMDKGELVATGSARSVHNFDIVAALNSAKELLTKYGGHTQAAGFTLITENIPALHSKLLEYAETLDEEALGPIIEIDAEAGSPDLTFETYDLLSKFEPFGYGNHRPKLVTFGFEVMDMRLVGAVGRHLKLRVRLQDKVLEAIAFNQAFWMQSLKIGQKVDIVYELSCNEWNNQRNLELKVIDLKPNG
ncbi:MAG: single-stranded-DNA-specific exonuclease RecJ [Candidatus Doudnabacteria bacterium]|nr:single-stranded-DNA-specific exonuclease RecJ [Candidatus Doudnabacteria bacterium]